MLLVATACSCIYFGTVILSLTGLTLKVHEVWERIRQIPQEWRRYGYSSFVLTALALLFPFQKRARVSVLMTFMLVIGLLLQEQERVNNKEARVQLDLMEKQLKKEIELGKESSQRRDQVVKDIENLMKKNQDLNQANEELQRALNQLSDKQKG